MDKVFLMNAFLKVMLLVDEVGIDFFSIKGS